MKKNLRLNLNKGLRKNRVRARMLGTAERPRLSVFRSNRYTYAQLIDDHAGKTLASASTRSLDKKGPPKKGEARPKSGGKADKAKTLGQQLAETAKKAGIKSAIFDRGSYKYHGRVKAIAEGARENGLKF